MDYLGLFCLGAFVGTIAIIGLRKIGNVDDWQKVLLATMPVVLSGATITFVDRFKYSPAIGCYPLGLVAALMWIYIDKGINNIITDGKWAQKAIGWLHIAASSLFTLASIVLISIPAILQILAETRIPPTDRVNILAKEREKAWTIKPEKEEQNPKPTISATPALNR
jgi:hypothetical protein